MALGVTAVRKLGVPFQPELAVGAIEEGGIRTIHQDVVSMTGVTSNDLAAAERREQVDLKRRFQRFRGSTPRAACHVARVQGASRVVLAVPVAPPGALRERRRDADNVICLHEAEPLGAVGLAYAYFTQTSFSDLPEKAEKCHGASAREPANERSARDEEVVVAVDSPRLAGHLHPLSPVSASSQPK